MVVKAGKTRSCREIETGEVPTYIGVECVFCEVNQVLEQAAQRGLAAVILENF